jgi:hypothetical protein
VRRLRRQLRAPRAFQRSGGFLPNVRRRPGLEALQRFRDLKRKRCDRRSHELEVELRQLFGKALLDLPLTQ